MKQLVVLLTLIFLTGHLYSQPGGDGGLIISGIYNDKLEPVHFRSDTTLKIRMFIMRDKIATEEIFSPFQMNENGNPGFFVPAHGNRNNKDERFTQKVYLIYKQDTMIVDFIGVIAGNAGGYMDIMDSLQIQRGYFRFFRTTHQFLSRRGINEKPKSQPNGLTLHSKDILKATGLLEISDSINTQFLLEKNLPANYFLKRARYYLHSNRPESALLDISLAIKKNHGKKDEETLYLLWDAYTKTHQFEKAIQSASEVINCKNCKWSDENFKESAYGTRMNLFIKINKLDKAKQDCDSIVALSGNNLSSIIGRATFEITFFKDYKGAIRDYKKVIDNIPNDHLKDRPQGASEYSIIYFNLGLAEYHVGDSNSAFKHWLKAEEFGYGAAGSITHFDSLIYKHSNVPELYLARAIVQFYKGPGLGGGDSAMKCYTYAILDINKAEELGLTDFRVNMFRAFSLMQLHRHEDAMAEINIAISKNKNDPRCFLIRNDIRSYLLKTMWGEDKFSDINEYIRLSKTWKWEK